MTRDMEAWLAEWLGSSIRRVGQLTIAPVAEGWELRHTEDAARADLALFTKWEDARALANLDDAGAFRPLKTAPNLRHGWRLVLPSVGGVKCALDFFYPAMLGLWLAHTRGELAPVHLRDTLARQTGMYRITQKLSDEQAQALIGTTCRSAGGCMKTILWRVNAELPVCSLPAEKFAVRESDGLPLLCHEACNLLVAEARKAVKGAA